MRSLKYAILFLLLLFAPLPLPAQEGVKSIKIRVLDAWSRKPIKKEKLYIFFGTTPQEVRLKRSMLERYTDSDGAATVPLDRATLVDVQVWTDSRMLCQKDPNLWSFAVADIVRTGEQAPNNCGKAIVADTPGTLVVFVRRLGRQERKNRQIKSLVERLEQR